MNLTATTHTLEMVQSTANALHYECSWTDIDKSSASTTILPGSAQGIVSAATTTTIVAAPGASIYRTVTSLALRAVGGAQVVSVQKDVSGTNYSAVSATLAVDESLHYEDANGWYVLDASGSRKGIGATGAAGVNGGGTVLGSGTSIINFGSSGSSHTTLVVTGLPLILAGSLVYCWIKPEATLDHSADEHVVEDIRVYAADIVAGTGFTIHGIAGSEIVRDANYRRLSRFSGAGQDQGPGQAARQTPNMGGTTPLLYGRYSVGWIYTQ
jgi:hypothetical protein